MIDESTLEGGFQFRGIDVLDHKLEPTLPDEVNPVIGFRISLLHRVDKADELVQVELSIQIENAETKKRLGSVQTCCTFATKNVLTSNSEQDEVNIDQTLVDTMNSLAISTTRGIAYAYFANTYLHPLVLPVIDPKSFQPDSQ